MAFGGIDLNLLVVLQALLEEGNVTRAGMRLGMPQPAVSNALARLRRHYRDELLVRAGNGYELTPLARSLLPSVQESTRRIGRMFSPGLPGQPPMEDRMFTISLSDYSMTVLGQPLVRRVHDLAPGVSLKLRLAAKDMVEGDRGLLGYDLLIAPPRPSPDSQPPGNQPEVLLRDRIVYVADPANPRLRVAEDGMWRLTAEDLAALPHAAVRLPDPAADTAAAALLRRGIQSNVVITTGGWLPLPFLITGTDMVAAIPERLAYRLATAAGVSVVEPPFEMAEFVEAAWWHPLHATDLGLTWLRGIVADVSASLAPVPALPGQRRHRKTVSLLSAVAPLTAGGAPRRPRRGRSWRGHGGPRSGRSPGARRR